MLTLDPHDTIDINLLDPTLSGPHPSQYTLHNTI